MTGEHERLPVRGRREVAEPLALIDEILASHQFVSTYGPRGCGASNAAAGADQPQSVEPIM